MTNCRENLLEMLASMNESGTMPSAAGFSSASSPAASLRKLPDGFAVSPKEPNKKHQVRVTHSALGLHKPGNPRNGPKTAQPSSREWLLGKRPAVAPAGRNGAKGTSWGPAWRRDAGKGTEYAPQRCGPRSQGLHEASPLDTVKAEKGDPCPIAGQPTVKAVPTPTQPRAAA